MSLRDDSEIKAQYFQHKYLKTIPKGFLNCQLLIVNSKHQFLCPWMGLAVRLSIPPQAFGVVVFKLAVGGFDKTKGKPFVEQKMEAGEGFWTGKHLAAKIGPGFG